MFKSRMLLGMLGRRNNWRAEVVVVVSFVSLRNDGVERLPESGLGMPVGIEKRGGGVV